MKNKKDYRDWNNYENDDENYDGNHSNENGSGNLREI
jgi:hypothetical protein